MRSLVIQAAPTGVLPAWIDRCIGTVKSWAALKGLQYQFLDHNSFAICGAEYLARVGHNERSVVDLGLLELVRDAHRRNYDRVIWVDVSVLVFRPELFCIDVVERYALARATNLSIAGERWRSTTKVGNQVLACMKDDPDLDMLIEMTRHVGVHRRISNSLNTGTNLLTGLWQSFDFEMLDQIGRFGVDFLRALANNDEPTIEAYSIAHETPIFAASLEFPSGNGKSGGAENPDALIDRLLETKGDIVNRWLLRSPRNLLHGRPKTGMAALFSDEVSARLQFKQKHGYEPNLSRPQSFNERIAARKLVLTDDIYRRTTDKYEVREYVADRVGADILIPLFQVAESAREVDFEKLPSSFVLKPTHGSGWKELVRDRLVIDREYVRAKMRRWLRSSFSSVYFEVQYKNIRPRIVAEQLLVQSDGQLPDEYRLFVMKGRVRAIAVIQNMKTPNARATWFDPSWRRLVVQSGIPRGTNVKRPPTIEKMLGIAAALASGLEFARIDLYRVDNRIYFGEITHTPSGGLMSLQPPEFDLVLGRIWETGEQIPRRFYAQD